MIPIIVDANEICHKAKHTMKDLSYEQQQVGVVFGFFMKILSLAKQYDTNRFIFTWDSKKSHRLKIFPAYKEKRRTLGDKTPEEIEYDKLAKAQFDLLYEELLPKIGFKNNYKISGFEGDDIIAAIVYDNPLEDFYIYTTDQDLYQCLDEGVAIINSGGKYTSKVFEQKFGIKPIQWIDVKALAGCNSDEIPGIKGIGEKKAIEYITGRMNVSHKSFQSITCKEGKLLVARNKTLITLPFPGCPEIKIIKDEQLSFDNWMEICKSLNFQYFLKREQLNQWKHTMLR